MAKKMTRKEVCTLLGVSSSTLDRWRKKAEIYDQTSAGIGKKHLEVLKTLASQRTKNSRATKVSSLVTKKTRNDDTFGNKMTIDDDESKDLKQLKQQYNLNLELIAHLERGLRAYIKNGEVPDKNTADMMEKYQKLNTQTLKAIEKMRPSDDPEGEVMKMLAAFMGDAR